MELFLRFFYVSLLITQAVPPVVSLVVTQKGKTKGNDKSISPLAFLCASTDVWGPQILIIDWVILSFSSPFEVGLARTRIAVCFYWRLIVINQISFKEDYFASIQSFTLSRTTQQEIDKFIFNISWRGLMQGCLLVNSSHRPRFDTTVPIGEW